MISVITGFFRIPRFTNVDSVHWFKEPAIGILVPCFIF